MARILAVCLSATIERTITFRNLEFAEVNRSEKYRIDASGKAVNAARVLNQIEPGCVTSVVPLGERNADVFLDLADHTILLSERRDDHRQLPDLLEDDPSDCRTREASL